MNSWTKVTSRKLLITIRWVGGPENFERLLITVKGWVGRWFWKLRELRNFEIVPRQNSNWKTET